MITSCYIKDKKLEKNTEYKSLSVNVRKVTGRLFT